MTVTIENLYTGNGSTTDYSFTFPYLDTTDIKVSLATVATTAYSLLNATTVRFNTAPGNGVAIRIYRETAFETPKATFYPGSAIRANDLNDNTLQNLYVNQESNDKVDRAWLTGDPTVISTESWHTTDDTKVATTKAIEGRIDTKIDSALTDDIAAGSSISITDNSPSSGKVTINVIAATGSNSGSMSASDKSKLDGIDTGAKDDQTAAEIRALVESATDSNVFTDADHSKLNGIDVGAKDDQTAAEIRALVESATDSNVFTDNDHSRLNAMENNATADQTAAEIKTLLQSDKLTSSEIATGALDNQYYTETELDAGQLDNRYYTETESDARYFNISTGDTIKDGDAFPDNDTTIATTAAINDRIIDLVDDVGGFVPIANETSFPNANPDVNNGTGTLVSIKALSSNLTSNGSGVATISNGTVGNSTVTITGLENSTTYAATLGMIVETTSTLNTYAFHRVTPKATEVTTVAGSISNVNTVAGNISNVNTVAGNNTNINTVAGNNTNINTVAAANSNITTVAGNNTNITTVAGANSNISTVATNIANVNTVGGAISNVNTVATNISSVNDFAARYRISSSAPTSSLDTGDLYFDTTGNELKVYNGSAWQGGVTATGNLLSKAGDQMTGNLTFSGSQTVDGRDLSVDGAKLDNIAANANNYTHPNHTGEVTSTADGATVVADNIIDEANLKVSNSPTNGQFLSAQSGNTGGLTWATPTSIGGSTGVDFDDGVIVQFGTDNDLKMYHENTSHTTRLHAYNDRVIDICYNEASSGLKKSFIEMYPNGGSVSIRHGGVTRLSTTSSGVNITGGLNLTDHLTLDDTDKIKLGDGEDLQIYHDGSNSYIADVGTGELRLRGTTVRITDHDGSENFANFNDDGAVELYYDNSKKLETYASGLYITGHIVANQDNATLILGAGNDLSIYHDSSGDSYITNSTGSLKVQSNYVYINDADGNNHIRCEDGSYVSLHYDSVKRFETTSGGVKWTGNATSDGHVWWTDDKKAQFGASNDLEIYHDGTNSYIKNNHASSFYIQSNGNLLLEHTNGDNYFKGVANGAAELYYDNAKKAETASWGLNVLGNCGVGDSSKFQCGDSQDLQIYHDGTYTWSTDASTGGWHSKSSKFVWQAYDDGENMAIFHQDGAVRLYYDGSEKFATQATGVKVYGDYFTNDSNKINLGTGNDLQIYHDGSHSYLKNTTGNIRVFSSGSSEAISIVADGAVSLSHANAVKLATTSGGVDVTGALTVNGAALSSAPTITATADGAIAANKVCIMKSNSKVEQAQTQTPTDEVDESQSSWVHNASSHKYIYPNSTAYDTVNKKFLHVSISSNNKPQLMVGTTSGLKDEAAISWSAVTEVTTSKTIDSSIRPCVFYNPGLKKFLLTWANHGTDNNVHLCHVEMDSSGALTIGSIVSAPATKDGSGNTAAGYGAYQGWLEGTYDGASQAIIVAFYTPAYASPWGYSHWLAAINMTGSTPIWPTHERYQLHADGQYNSSTNRSFAYDENAGKTLLTTRQHRLIWYGNVEYDFMAYTITVGTTNDSYTCTRGTEVSMGTSSTSGYYNRVAYCPEKQCCIVSYTNSSSSNYVRTLTVNGTNAPTAGTEASFTHDDGGSGYTETRRSQIAVHSGSGSEAAYQIGQRNDLLTTSYLIKYVVSGSSNETVTVSFHTPIAWKAGGDLTSWGNGDISNSAYNTYSIGDNIHVIGYHLTSVGGGYAGQAYGSFWMGGTNANADNFLGFSSAAYSDGATATINVVGNTTTQSGLTAGSKYYSNGAGTLSTTSTGRFPVGLALSATSLLIKH